MNIISKLKKQIDWLKNQNKNFLFTMNVIISKKENELLLTPENKKLFLIETRNDIKKNVTFVDKQKKVFDVYNDKFIESATEITNELQETNIIDLIKNNQKSLDYLEQIVCKQILNFKNDIENYNCQIYIIYLADNKNTLILIKPENINPIIIINQFKLTLRNIFKIL